jgi:hypothetical protein
MGSILTREYHLRTLNFRRYNFCGPNTRLNNRLNPDRTPKNWSKPINRVDEICMRHDLGYRNGSRRETDETMLRELNELENSDLTCNELLAKYFTTRGYPRYPGHNLPPTSAQLRSFNGNGNTLFLPGTDYHHFISLRPLVAFQ